ncbi:Serine protease, DegP/HtrA, do-like (EC 3.4.21.-) [Oscillospiraceae bacterium]|nr:Serine protease, DegP/HtrA, do-like (EC 3.4.21.-) [Oscillospiraceae bacterium]
MGYDQNNDYYSNGDQSWRDQTNVYQTQREQPTSMGRRSPRRKSGWLKGILAVLLVVAISFGAFYLMRNVGVRLERTEDGVTLSMTNRSKQAEPEQAEQPIPSPSASAQTETAAPQQTTQQPTQGAYVGSGTKLNIVSSQESSDTTFSDEEDALSLQDIYSTVIDSVVSISSMTSSGTSSGTGIIMSPDGYVITNHHVITGALVISVLTNDNQEYEAALVGSDEMSDLAVLKIDARGLQAAEFGDSSKLRVGDSVVAIGDPLGVQLRGTMTNGIISAINRDLTVGDRTMTLIQTNAALNNGNSGGPLINCYGQVIGINTVKMSSYYTATASVEGLGFAIPISVAKPIIDELIENGYVAGRPAIGISGDSLPSYYRTYYRLPDGVYVTSVNEGSDAKAKGIREGDIVTAINGEKICSIDELNTVKNQYAAGDEVTLTIYRSGTYYEVTVTLVDQATGK